MRERVGGKSLGLKVSLSDTELLSVLRERASSLLGKTNDAPDETGEGSKSDVFAYFSTKEDAVTLTGLLNKRRSIHFNLKPQTKTYGNFLKFFLRELKNLSPTDALEDSSLVPADAQKAVSQLTSYLEVKLRELNEHAQANAEEIAGIVDVFSDDLVPSVAPSKASTNPSIVLRSDLAPANGHRSARFVLDRTDLGNKKSFRLVDGEMISPRHISGFLSLEIKEVPDAPTEEVGEKLALLRNSFRVLNSQAEVNGAESVLTFNIDISSSLVDSSEFVVHWGMYGGNEQQGWVDEEVSRAEILPAEEGAWKIRKIVRGDVAGDYGATLYARLTNSTEKVWAGASGGRDLQFSIVQPDTHHEIEYRRQVSVERYEFRATLLRALSDYERFTRVIAQLVRSRHVRSLGRSLFEVTKDDAGLRRLLSEYYHRAVVELGQKTQKVSKGRLKTVVRVLQNIGIGEVVFVAPEGPHAIAGGLAQVIVGLSSALDRLGISTTIVTPLYEEAQGNKHRAAEEVIRTGVEIAGRVVALKEVGEVRIPIGPTLEAGTSRIKQCATIAVATVYLAESGGVRIFFLRHRRLADRLYGPAGNDDQLRKSVFLSRGTLELIRDSQFGIHPHIVVTNDWLSALIPAYLRVDPRYQQDPILRKVESIHILHNCGRDYQGRFYTNYFGEDLWPIFGLSPEHYFGMTDPHDRSCLNLTAGAIYHAGKGLLAVSRPYAQQLLSSEGGEGLETLFRTQAHSLFGISNGIDLQAVREVFWRLGEDARKEIGLEPALAGGYTNARLQKRLITFKRATKTLIQRRLGLEENSDAILISLVGRLVEQKGIQLLADPASPGGPSSLEFILRNYPAVQFLIGGPPAWGDPAMEKLNAVATDLMARYPGRVKVVLSFIPHREALEITEASDFFLMPSRFEPGGITQLEALACGTPVIARKVGGLAATLIDYTEEGDRGNSFLFSEFTSRAFQSAVCRAIEVFEDQERREWLIRQAALAENDWNHRAPKHVAVLQYVAGVLNPDTSYPHLHGRRHLLASIRP